MPITILPEWLEIDGETTATPAIKHHDLDPLLSQEDRDDNDTVPYLHGRNAFIGWREQVDEIITWHINGFRDPDGVTIANPLDGLEENIEYYRALFRDDVDAAGRKPIELHKGAVVYEGLMQCRRWRPIRTSPGTADVITRLVIPAGQLTIAP